MKRRLFLSLLPAAIAAPAIARVLPAPRPALTIDLLDLYIQPALRAIQENMFAQHVADLAFLSGEHWAPRIGSTITVRKPQRWTTREKTIDL